MSLRLRVALFTAIGTTLLMAVGVVVVLNVFRTDQVSTLDRVLEAQHELLGPPVLRAIRLERPLAEALATDRLLSSATAIRVWDGGEVVFEAGPDDFLRLPAAAPGHSTMAGDDDRYRVLSDVIGRDLQMEVAISLGEADTVYGLLRQRLRRLVLAGAVLFGVAGWAAATGALAPLARLRRRVEGIAGTEDLDIELGSDSAPLEVADLTEAFEAMLSRLREAGQDREEALEAARVFAAAAAHELRTPLTSIGANLELLQAHPDTPDRVVIVGDLTAEHRRIVTLLDSLRALSRGDLTGPEVFEALDLSDIVERAVQELRRAHPDALIETRVPEDSVVVRGWAQGLRLLVDNLIVNAATHGRRDGERAQIVVGLEAGHEGVVLSVADRGPGIPPSERGLVVDRFTRGGAARGDGSGLGLALVTQQARIHGGSVSIGDTPGGGATVTVRLPSSAPHDAHRVSTD